MIVIKFGKWSAAGLGKYTYDRIYWRVHRWTPFCYRKRKPAHEVKR